MAGYELNSSAAAPMTYSDRSPLAHRTDTNLSPPLRSTLSPILRDQGFSSRPRHRPAYAREVSSAQVNPKHTAYDGDIGTGTGTHQGLGIESFSDGRRSIDTEPDTPDPNDGRNHHSRYHDKSVNPLPFSFASSARLLDESFADSSKSPFLDRSPPSTKPRPSYTGVFPFSRGSGGKQLTFTIILDFSPKVNCPSRQQIWKSGTHHIYITLLSLSVFSTIFSGIYLGIALARPQYQGFIDDVEGNLTFSNASLLFALFAKLTELSFITVFVAFVGQVISRRAFVKSRGHGVTLVSRI